MQNGNTKQVAELRVEEEHSPTSTTGKIDTLKCKKFHRKYFNVCRNVDSVQEMGSKSS